MELPMIREACLRVLVLCTIFLKEAAAFGLCLSEIGEMMSREYRGHEEEPSELEIICIEAKKLLDEEISYFEPKAGKEEFQFELDCGEEELDLAPTTEEKMKTERTFRFGSKGGNGRYLLSKLEESAEEGMDEHEGSELPPRSDDCVSVMQDLIPNVSKLSTSLKNISIGKKSWQHLGSMQKNGYLVGTSSGNRSVNEQLPMSSSFVKLADMNEEEWMPFLENFQRLLRPAFANRKTGNVGQRQRQRLGTSC